MDAVFRAKDFGRDNRKIIENAVKDFSPELKIMSLNYWFLGGGFIWKKMGQILRQDKSEELLGNIAQDVNLSEDERIRLRNMFD